jgi:cellulose synthase operon protein C
LQEKRLLGLTRINNFLLTLATAAFTLTAFPAGHAADAPDATQKTDTAVDLRRETELRTALKADPNNAEAHLQLGRIHLDKGNWTAAAAEARAARSSGTRNDEADALLAWALYLEGKYNVLFRQVEPGEREATSESMVRMSLGLAALYTFEFDRAEPLLRDAVRLDPGSYRAHIALARLLILQRKLPEARELLDAARAIGPSEIGVTRITGELLRAQGDTTGAIAAFSKVLEAAPTSLPAIAGRVDALISENKLSEAQRDVSLALRGDNSHPQLVFLGALILARQNKLAEADRLLTTANAAFGHMPIGYYLQGVVRFRLGRYEIAEFDLAKFQGKQPDVPGVARLRAEIALHRKDPAGAIKLLEPVVKANPADQSAVTELARAYLATGRSDQVLQLYEQLATASPERVVTPGDPAGLLMIYGDAYGDLMEIEKVILTKAPDVVTPMTELRQGDLTKASALAESLAGSTPNDPVIQNLLGSVRLAQKRLPEAEAIFRGVLDKNRDFTPAAFNLVQVLVAEQRQDEAKAMLHDLAPRG